MSVISKEDIEKLTKQVLRDRKSILESIKNGFVELDESLLPDRFAKEMEETSSAVANVQAESGDDGDDDDALVTLEDMEAICARFDDLDKQLTDFKPPLPQAAARKEHGMKRMGSLSDVNRSMMRSMSTSSMNLAKGFAEPQRPAPKVNATLNSASTVETATPVRKLTVEDLENHNAIKVKVEEDLEEMRLNSNENDLVTKLDDIKQKYVVSLDRLNKFSNEIQKMQSNKSAEVEGDSPLKDLDHELLTLLNTFKEGLQQARFISENRNLYNADGINEIDPALSDELTEILELYYRETK